MTEDGLSADCLCATGAIRPGHWLYISHAEMGQVLYVADEDREEARRLWPDVNEWTIQNRTRSLEPVE